MRERGYKYLPTLHVARKEMPLNLPCSAWNPVLFRMFQKRTGIARCSYELYSKLLAGKLSRGFDKGVIKRGY